MHRAWRTGLVAACVLALAACGGDKLGSAGQDALGGEDSSGEVAPWAAACADAPRLTLVALDVWGRRIQGATLTAKSAGLTNSAVGEDLDLGQRDGAQWPGGDGTWAVHLEAPGLIPADATLVVPAAWEQASFSVTDATTGARTALAVQSAVGASDGPCPQVLAFLGLDHPWYAAGGRPPRQGNRVDLLMDGEDFWAAVDADLRQAKSNVRGSTWWWQSNFELTRPQGHEGLTQEQRLANSMLPILESRPVDVRLLINRFLAETAQGMAYMNTDPEIRAKATTQGDGFEVILQGNSIPVPVSGTYEGPTPDFSFPARVAANPEFAGARRLGQEPAGGALEPSFEAASYHQKGLTIDGRVAFVVGMNVKSTDWDTHDHRVFESRRMKFLSSNEERQRVKDKLQLPDLGPRKDYGVRIEGPAAADVEDVFRVRWDDALASGAMYAEHSSPFQTPALAAPAGGTTLQVVATLPPPIAEQSILETWRKALAHAQRYIYIEDQYFRMPILNDLIARRLRDVPDLRLIVITKPVTPADGGKKYTVQSDDLFRATAPDRYLLLQLKSFDAVPRGEVAQGDESASFYFADMDVHSKILMVDDEYLSVGSCNKNNRGLLYEGELNVAVHDPAWVAEARREVFRNLVGPERAGDVSDDAATSFTLLRVIAGDNAAKEEWWRAHGPGLDPAEVESFATGMRPQGFVYPLALTPDYLLDVGPDAF